MGTLRTAWRVASAGNGGGGVGLAGAGLLALLVAEARLARNRIGRAIHAVPVADGVYGDGDPAETIRLAVIGDSAAAGYGIHQPEETPGSVMAAGLAAKMSVPVRLRSYAVVGARSFDLATQVALALEDGVDVAVLLVGSNDVTHLVPPGRAARYMKDAVFALRRSGVTVVVGTCPDLGTIKPILPPLRDVLRTMSRHLATLQAVATEVAGGHAVSLGSLLGPEFYADPAALFGPDRFHPSAAGYCRVSLVLVDEVVTALQRPVVQS
ncbi:SGNH/GDSL hydrolase family protein [Nocardioides sp. Kera G14]|uniref:SGNH/GDSL hydrolase family protein n=1 Tax=Nocardioides sp. Kera G14 TaxID=2884264 RepID=UPI001D104375|nr:SGNH/GDSL hydrolase family protein [Nocardioides sp. Kera G14]UDY22981.1 SGNH/GDSL hydrolase family protein [Nocardioides sp. Kera G14]